MSADFVAPESADQCAQAMGVTRAADQWEPALTCLARPVSARPAPTALAQLTTLRVGGAIGAYVQATSEAELIAAVRRADAQDLPLLVIGGGSNIFASDAGFAGLVVRDARSQVEVIADDRCSGITFTATAGTTWDDLVRQAIASHWGGFEALSGIPGTVGAAPVQNIGAYGVEVAQLISSVRAWDRAQARVVHLPLTALQMSYRNSALKRSLTSKVVGGGRTWGPTGRWVVLSVTFQVRPASLSLPIAYKQLADQLGVEVGQRVDARAVRQAVIALRRSKGMVLDPADYDTWSAGSFFTNPILTAAQARHLPPAAPRYPVADSAQYVSGMPLPAVEGVVKTSAAWLIQQAGFGKGFALPNLPVPGTSDAVNAAPAPPRASLSTKHVLALTNRGKARAADVAALRDAVIAGVTQAFGVELIAEPVSVGW